MSRQSPAHNQASHTYVQVLDSKIWIVFICATPPPPQRSRCILFAPPPPDAHAIFLHNDLLCNGTCCVSRGFITFWRGGRHKRKRSQNFFQTIYKKGRRDLPPPPDNQFTGHNAGTWTRDRTRSDLGSFPL